MLQEKLRLIHVILVYKTDNVIYTVHSEFWSSKLTAAATNVFKLLHDSPSFTCKLLTLDLVVDVIELEVAEPTFVPLNGTVLHKFVFCTKLLPVSELAK